MVIKLIKEKKFAEAVKRIDFSQFKKYYEAILNEAYHDEDICFYEFLKYIIEYHENTAQMHYSASELMSSALNFLPGGYKIAFEHARKAIKLAPSNISYKEYILLFNELPDKLLDEATANKYARDILQVDAYNKAAKKNLAG